ncbi:MAG: hypothetical protein FWE04_08420 [Oscillospiraceae bacterium]|nr:hypothetical protein [Oscillospiraceae bacterium]
MKKFIAGLLCGVIILMILSACSADNDLNNYFSLEINADEIYRIEDYSSLPITDRAQIQAMIEHLNSYLLTDIGNISVLNDSPDIWLRLLDAEGSVKWHLCIYGGGVIRILDPTFESGFSELGRYRIINGRNAVWEFWEKFDR